MSSLGDKISKFFKPKSERRAKEEKAKKLGLPVHIMDMPEGSDKDRAIAVHKANQKKNKKGDNYECGGVKFSKLKDRMKKGKKD